mgnify:CR=1 FL=1
MKFGKTNHGCNNFQIEFISIMLINIDQKIGKFIIMFFLYICGNGGMGFILRTKVFLGTDRYILKK